MQGEGGAPAPPTSPADLKRKRLMLNLEAANRSRFAKKALREAIRAGQVDDLQILRGDSRYEDLVAGWPVERLLLLMRRIGKSRATDILDFCRVRPETKLRNVPFARRAELAAQVEDMRGGRLKR